MKIYSNTLLIIEDHIYDVSRYIKDHPGEGIRNVYLMDFHGKECTSLVDRHHTTNEPYEIMERARENGYHKGVYWVCPNFFGKRIPKYFHFSPDGLDKTLENDGEFSLKRNENDIFNSAVFTLKSNGNITDLIIKKNIEDYWCFEDLKDLKLAKLIEKIVGCQTK